MFPARLHDTRQTTSGNLLSPVEVPSAGAGLRWVWVHGELGVCFDQMITERSYEQSELDYEARGEERGVPGMR